MEARCVPGVAVGGEVVGPGVSCPAELERGVGVFLEGWKSDCRGVGSSSMGLDLGVSAEGVGSLDGRKADCRGVGSSSWPASPEVLAKENPFALLLGSPLGGWGGEPIMPILPIPPFSAALRPENRRPRDLEIPLSPTVPPSLLCYLDRRQKAPVSEQIPS